SLYLMLTSKKAVNLLKNIRYLIIDEIHTMLGTKRGVHLAVSVERLQHLVGDELVRIGLSATVNPIESAARYLGGLKKSGERYAERPVAVVAPVMERSKDLQIFMPVPDYRVLEQGSIWPEIYDSIFKLINQHQSTIVFVNNRAVAERVAANLNSMVDEDICRPHHGSLSKTKRLEVEDQFKKGQLKCMIATSTLELGIDIGSVDLMIQVASPVSVSSGLQRLGRAGHRLGATSTGRIIPKTRGDLVKSAFIAKEMLEGHIEQEHIPTNCLDILSQHIVSMSCQGKWTQDEMLEVIRSAWSYKSLKESDFLKVLAMLAGDFEHMDDIPAQPRIFWDRQNKTLEGTTYSRMLAINSSGTIPDRGYFSVVLEDYKTRIGELDEVFVFEARLGDRFMLGNSAWKIEKIEKNRVIVTPSSSVGAKTPFWQGDGIGCPYEQGMAYGRFLKELCDKLDSDDFIESLTETGMMDETAALNIKNYLMDQREVLGCVSHDKRIVVEYLKDDVSDQQIMIHAHFGGRVNSVLAVLMQKALEETIRCQAYASHSNDAILIHIYGCPDSLSNVLSLLKPQTVENILLEMLPSTSRFAMTFRYNAYRALMMGVRNLGQRLPLWIQRLRSVDALENARKTMDHPLLVETMRECLEEIFDIPHAIRVLEDIRSGRIEVVERNTWFPSPFATELLFEFKFVMMYAEKEAHPSKNHFPVVSGIDALNLSYHQEERSISISPEAVLEVKARQSAISKLSGVSSVNELHSFLLIYGDLTDDEITDSQAQDKLAFLLKEKRVLAVKSDQKKPVLYIAAEEAELYSSALKVPISRSYGNTSREGSDVNRLEDSVTEMVPKEVSIKSSSQLIPSMVSPIEIPSNNISREESSLLYERETWTHEDAVLRVIRRFSRYHSPFSPVELEARYGLPLRRLEHILVGLRSEGLLVSGSFTGEGNSEYCHIKIYESIIRKDSSLKANEVVARPATVYAAFLASWQKIGAQTISAESALLEVVSQLEGLYLPCDWWENIVFPARIKGYAPSHLDRLCASGKVFWRISPEQGDKGLLLAWYLV
ncbi:MAG: helicase-related protein, partial [Clostridia bacterium]|nr:helicase-related protein [Clostridia bacterium]